MVGAIISQTYRWIKRPKKSRSLPEVSNNDEWSLYLNLKTFSSKTKTFSSNTIMPPRELMCIIERNEVA